MAYSFLKVFPLIKPFFKEMFMGGNVPTAGKTRNRLLPVLGIMLVVLIVTAGSLVKNWVDNYDRVQALELQVGKLQQQLTESSRLLVMRDNEITSLSNSRKELVTENEQLKVKLKTLESTGNELLVTYQGSAAKILEQEKELAKLRVELEQRSKRQPIPVSKKRNSKYIELLKENQS